MAEIKYHINGFGEITDKLPSIFVTFGDIGLASVIIFNKIFVHSEESMNRNNIIIKVNDLIVGDRISYDAKINDYNVSTIYIYYNPSIHPVLTTRYHSVPLESGNSFINKIARLWRARLRLLSINRNRLEESIVTLNRSNASSIFTLIRGNVILNIGISDRTRSNTFSLSREVRSSVLSRDAFLRIKTITFDNSIDNEHQMCTVCQCDFEDGDVIKVLGCDHRFHDDCVEGWLTGEKNECPLCRQPVGQQEDVQETLRTVTDTIHENELD